MVWGKWGEKIFRIDPSVIYTPTEVKRKAEGTRNSITNLPDKKKPVEIGFVLHIGTIVGIDVESEIEWWEDRINHAEPLILGNRRFGPGDMLLNKSEVDGVITNSQGVIIEAEIALEFGEMPSWDAVESALTADAKEKAKYTSDAKEKNKILNTDLKAAINAAKLVFDKT